MRNIQCRSCGHIYPALNNRFLTLIACPKCKDTENQYEMSQADRIAELEKELEEAKQKGTFDDYAEKLSKTEMYQYESKIVKLENRIAELEEWIDTLNSQSDHYEEEFNLSEERIDELEQSQQWQDASELTYEDDTTYEVTVHWMKSKIKSVEHMFFSTVEEEWRFKNVVSVVEPFWVSHYRDMPLPHEPDAEGE